METIFEIESEISHAFTIVEHSNQNEIIKTSFWNGNGIFIVDPTKTTKIQFLISKDPETLLIAHTIENTAVMKKFIIDEKTIQKWLQICDHQHFIPQGEAQLQSVVIHFQFVNTF